AEVIQARIVLKQWVAGVAIHSGLLEPAKRELGLVQEGIRSANVVGGGMKMAETFSPFYGELDFLLRLNRFTCCGEKHGLHARKLATLVRGIVSQGLLEESSCFLSLAKTEESPRRLATHQRRIEFLRNGLKNRESLLIQRLMVKNYADPVSCAGIGGIECQRPLHFVHRLLQEPDVKIDHPELLVRLF